MYVILYDTLDGKTNFLVSLSQDKVTISEDLDDAFIFSNDLIPRAVIHCQPWFPKFRFYIMPVSAFQK